jgi:hypothetical protein
MAEDAPFFRPTTMIGGFNLNPAVSPLSHGRHGEETRTWNKLNRSPFRWCPRNSTSRRNLRDLRASVVNCSFWFNGGSYVPRRISEPPHQSRRSVSDPGIWETEARGEKCAVAWVAVVIAAQSLPPDGRGKGGGEVAASLCGHRFYLMWFNRIALFGHKWGQPLTGPSFLSQPSRKRGF